MEAPTGEELARHPWVREFLDAAWAASLADDPNRRHEEGGWIYADSTGKVAAVCMAFSKTGQAYIDLSEPLILPRLFIVGKFHTHPNPRSEGWECGPSDADRQTDAFHGVPDLILAEDGIHLSGPERREGGLAGNPGYP